MLAPLRDPRFRHLFAAQVSALVGTGLMTVALALLAYEIAGGRAGLVLGAVLTVKMVAYVLIAPLAGALATVLPRRGLLVALDLVRAAAALLFPFATEIWHVFALVALLQSASAAFTPTFQATIPDILPDEATYTRALSLSRLAVELEHILSPALAALVLLALSFDALFLGTLAGFLLSAALILRVRLPAPEAAPEEGFARRTTRGLAIYIATPRLRGLLAVSFATAAAGAMVLVNTVVLVRDGLGLGESAVAVALGAFGAGSMVAAMALPRLLDGLPDRPVMLAGTGIMAAALILLAALYGLSGPGFAPLLAAWMLAGIGYSAALTPSGRLLRRSAHAQDRPPIFAAQFALSHLCWLATYPLAGALMTAAGAVPSLLVMGVLAAAGGLASARLWPRHDAEALDHDHPELPPDHPHLQSGRPHSHAYRIDALHPRWPEPR